MNKYPRIISLRTQEAIDSEAADWLVKLDGGRLSAKDRRALRTWLSEDPEHAQALKRLVSIWSDMDIVLNDLPDTHQSKTRNILSILLPAKWLSPALIAVFLGVVGLSVWLYFPVDRQSIIETAFHATEVGIQHVEQFSDGSMAHLNTDSIIETEYSNSSRIVRLLRGEAMFDVVHDPIRPFIVYAGNQQVKVVGTKFVVRLTSENIIVTVTDGQVQLSKRQKTESSIAVDQVMTGQQQEVILVSEGEEVEIGNKVEVPELKVVSDEELDRRFSWLSGQLVFRDERLEQIIKEISRYVPARIVIEDPDLKDVRISGRFEIGDTDALLEAIEVSFNVQTSHIENKVIHLSPIN